MNKEIRLKGWAMISPYVYTVGLFIMSYGLKIGGLKGMPTANQYRCFLCQSRQHPLPGRLDAIHRSDGNRWCIDVYRYCDLYHKLFYNGIFKSRSDEEDAMVTFPISEPLHDEPATWLRNFKPYVIIAIILIILSYTPVIYDVIQATYEGSLPLFTG
jgi:cytochrome c oxidase subunit I